MLVHAELQDLTQKSLTKMKILPFCENVDQILAYVNQFDDLNK